MSSFIKKALLPIIIFTLLLIFMLHLINNQKNNNAIKSNYVLKSYKNTVALYNGEEIITIYDSIVLNTLPSKDIQNFNNGIPVSTKAQAETYLEDFDG